MKDLHLTRRELLTGAAMLIPVIRSRTVRSAIGHRFRHVDDRIAEIERHVGGRLGVAALDTASGARIDHRGDERFAMCSTFKFLAAAATLKRVDEKKEQLDRRVEYGEKDLLDYAPITRQHVGEGSMTLAALCAAAIEYSDNTAGNLLLEQLGGPAGLTSYARSIEDDVTRLDRTEPTLNTALPGDERDTTSPAAMLGDMQKILAGDELSQRSRDQLAGWLVANTTGAARLRAGLPATWRVGDKTGSGERGAMGDIGITWPPERKPILIAVYLVESGAAAEARNAAFAEVGRVVSERFAR